MNRKTRRAPRGNMLVLGAAILVGIVVALLAFGLNYVKLLGGQQGQDSAIQSAALTAAQDISRIMVDTPDFGFVSFSDQAPIGTNTVVPDNYRLQIHSVNTIVGTCRLDYIIGDKLNDPIMRRLAVIDFNNLKNNVMPVLNKAITDSLVSGGTATDLDGKTIKPYDDAENAFLTNLKKFRSGTNCAYVPGSLKLSMGVLKVGNGVATNIQVPQPANLAPLQQNQQLSNCYVSDCDQTYKKIFFSFGAIGPTVRLLDTANWTKNNGLAFQIPAVVKAEADQKVVDNQNPNGLVIHAAACAQPASVYDPRPAPGALVVAFPDGPPSDINSPGDILTQSEMSKITVNTASNSGSGSPSKFANLMTSRNGDYPVEPAATMVPMQWALARIPDFSDIWRTGEYDWFRRAGTKLNIQAVLDFQSGPFTTPQNYKPSKDWITFTTESPNKPVNLTLTIPGPKIPVGQQHIYKFNSDGTISQTSKLCDPVPYTALAENQMYGECINADSTGNSVLQYPPGKGSGMNTHVEFKGISNLLGTELTFKPEFDCYIRDQCRILGKQLGGKHAGEPMDSSFTASSLPGTNNIAMGANKGKYSAKVDHGGGGYGADHTGGDGAGAIPILSVQSDFAELAPGMKLPSGAPPLLGQYPAGLYDKYPTGNGQMRPTYEVNGNAVEIKFRRQIRIGANIPNPILPTILIPAKDTGYLFLEY